MPDMPTTDHTDLPPAHGPPRRLFGPPRNLLQPGALQDAIFNSASFSSIATDDLGVIQVFNVGAQRMLGYSADEVLNRITPADISDPQEIVQRAQRHERGVRHAHRPGLRGAGVQGRGVVSRTSTN
jgi:two-component system cell cycle sensor histidine kinase PleC